MAIMFLVIPFGLTNPPVIYQYVMNTVLSPFLYIFVLFYLDDILIYRKSWDEHLRHLLLVLKALRENQFYCKPFKCLFGAEQVEYLGHINSGKGVSVVPMKVEDIPAWPTPTCLSELRSFLGLVQHYESYFMMPLLITSLMWLFL